MSEAMLHSAGLPAPDAQMIATFTDVVFGGLEGFVAVRMLAEKGSSDRQPWVETFPADDRLALRLQQCAKRAANDGRALFTVPAVLSRRDRALATNITATAVLLVDLDSGDIEAKHAFLVQELGPPTLTVASGGVTPEGVQKRHLYWRLTNPAREQDLAQVIRLRGVLAEKAGGDPSFDRVTQPIRVAGSLHGKDQPPVIATILERTEHHYSLTELAARIDAMEARFAAEPALPTGRPPKSAHGPSIADLKGMTVREHGLDGVTRFDTLSRVIGHWLRRVRLGEIGLDEGWDAVRDHNTAQIRPPWPEERLRLEFDALWQKDRANAVAGSEQGALNAELLSLPITEIGLAEAFVHRCGHDWRHVTLQKRWRRWAGDRWVLDETDALRHDVRTLCEAVAATQGTSDGDRRRIASLKTVQAVERLVAADPRVAITPAAFDADPMLLNTPAGVIDLATGETRSCHPDLLMIRITGAAPGGDCPLWRRFLEDITEGDAEKIAYLQRIAGYCLTGSTQEHAFFFLHGHGANGKSVFVNTIAAALGEYAKAAPFETFAATHQAKHETDLAGLCGARLVCVAETEHDRAWAESRIKTISGGDPISARFMRKDFFEYRPTYKLLIAGNHRPRLTGLGEAMRRRLHLIPFEVTIPEDRRDPELPQRLLQELGGVLAWMIGGCAAWRVHGLDPPAKVRAASAEYFADEDVLGEWLEVRCDVGPSLRETTARLYRDWTAFAEAAGHPPGSQRAFGEDLAARGFALWRSRRERGRSGLALRQGGSKP